MTSFRLRFGLVIAVAALMSFASGLAARSLAQSCGAFYCWDGLDAQGEEATAHDGIHEEPQWGSDWEFAGHFHMGPYENWHDYASPDYLEMSGHGHWNCG